MTIDEAKDIVGDTFESFAQYVCTNCAANDWYCPSYCDFLERLSNIGFEYVLGKFAHYEGDLVKFSRYFKDRRR